MRKATLYLVVGLFLGTMLAGPAVEAASGVLAERSAQTVFVNGVPSELEAYLIGGHNYVKLRDVGQAVNFNVWWDGAVQIQADTPYTGEAPKSTAVQPEPSATPPGETDYSAAANPEIFTGIYTREAYNAAYEVLTAARAGDFTNSATVHFAEYSDRQSFENLLINLANGTTLSMRSCGDDAYEIYAIKVDRSAADAATEELVRAAAGLNSDREKVIRLNNWICDHMTYNPNVFAGTNKIAAASEPVEGNCVSYASLMNYLCGQLGIPCLTVYGESHCWNMIFADGAWSYTDVSLNDQVYDRAGVLFDDSAPKKLSNSEGHRFLMELLVPGLTK